MRAVAVLVTCCLVLAAATVSAADTVAPPPPFQPMDVFELEWASDPQIAPDGRSVAYVRSHADVMRDAWKGDIWLINTDGSSHRPLVANAAAPRWSPDGKRLA